MGKLTTEQGCLTLGKRTTAIAEELYARAEADDADPWPMTLTDNQWEDEEKR